MDSFLHAPRLILAAAAAAALLSSATAQDVPIAELARRAARLARGGVSPDDESRYLELLAAAEAHRTIARADRRDFALLLDRLAHFTELRGSIADVREPALRMLRLHRRLYDQQQRTPIPELLEQANSLAEIPVPEAQESTYLDLLAAAELHDQIPAADADDFLQLLQRLSYVTTQRSQITDIYEPATRLLRLYGHMLRSFRDRPLSAGAYRTLAETSLHARNLTTMHFALEQGRTHAADDPLERTMTAVLSARLHAMLGRLETAGDFAGEAQQMAEELVRRAREQRMTVQAIRRSTLAELCLSNARLAAADVFLLDDQHERALEVLRRVPEEESAGDHSHAEISRRLIGAALGDDEAEQWLHEWLYRGPGNTRLYTLAAAKMVKLALGRSQDELALERYRTWRQATDLAVEAGEGRLQTLGMELALRGQMEPDADMLAEARGAFAAMLDHWRKAPQLAGGIGFLHLDDRATLLANLMRLELELDPDDGARRCFQHLLDAHSASKPGLPDRTRDEICAELLGEGHVLLAFVPGSFESLLLVVDREGQHIERLGPADTLRAHVAELVAAAVDQLAGGGAADAVDAAAQRTADALLPANVRKQLAASRRLTVNGAGMLQNVPIALLPINATGAPQPVGLRLPIDYVSNLQQGAAVAPIRTEGDMLLAGALLTTRGNSKPALIGEDNAGRLLEAYAGGNRKTSYLIDDELTVPAILARLPRCGIVHLVGHGVVDWHQTYENGIVFNDDGLDGSLWGDRIVEQDLSGLVAILSACRAGEAEWRRGGDPLAASLAGAILKAGARCVVVPTTDVRFETNFAAMAVVHRQLAAGLSPSEALMAASLAAKGTAARTELLLMQVHGRGF